MKIDVDEKDRNRVWDLEGIGRQLPSWLVPSPPRLSLNRDHGDIAYYYGPAFDDLDFQRYGVSVGAPSGIVMLI